MKECQKIREYLSEYVDGFLSDKDNAVVTQHLIECSACRQEFDRVKFISQRVQELPAAVPPDDFTEQLRRRVNERTHLESFLTRFLKSPSFKIPVAVAGILITVTVVFRILGIQYPHSQKERQKIWQAVQEPSAVQFPEGKSSAMKKNESLGKVFIEKDKVISEKEVVPRTSAVTTKAVRESDASERAQKDTMRSHVPVSSLAETDGIDTQIQNSGEESFVKGKYQEGSLSEYRSDQTSGIAMHAEKPEQGKAEYGEYTHGDDFLVIIKVKDIAQAQQKVYAMFLSSDEDTIPFGEETAVEGAKMFSTGEAIHVEMEYRTFLKFLDQVGSEYEYEVIPPPSLAGQQDSAVTLQIRFIVFP